MGAKMSKGVQILIGSVVMVVVWVLGILLSGEWTTADTMHISVFPESFEKPAMTIFPFFLISLLVIIGLFSAKKNYKDLFVTFQICTALPLISWGVGGLLFMIFPLLGSPFMILYSPIHVLRNFPLLNDVASVFAPLVFTALACLGGYASYRIVKNKLVK